MMMRLLLLSTVAGLFLLSACNVNQAVLKSGLWHAGIVRSDGREVVFNFEVKDSAGRRVIYVLNAGERLLVDQVEQKGDSVIIEMPFFDSGFKAILTGGDHLNGYWFKRLADTIQSMPFSAGHNRKDRFETGPAARFNVSGKWSVRFIDHDSTVMSVGEFVQNANHLTGTFLTTAGDYRFLEGIVTGDSLKLSGFDGGHAFLFTAKVNSDTSITGGNFYSGFAGFQTWQARRDPGAVLPDGYNEISLKPGESRLNFSFKNMEGQTVSINDARFRDKVVVVQLMGSWCPNCMDETSFLSNYYNRHRDEGLEVVALAYEYTADFNRSKKSLQLFQKRFDVKYPVLITEVAVTDSLRTEKTLPQLTDIKAFPTSLFIDKKGRVRKIYTGFNGPGTGVHYDQFIKEFNDTINGLLAEQG